uniref:Uncharacterized protein n=1 Tax=Tanacetum cinerariifolium TaxID=118510 RepID=A0A6L2MTN6_TANCI|nr:hypothetical protein [Tanacetum cinerariifolium]
MILYYRRRIIEDSRIARETDRLRSEMVAKVDEREQFLQELDALPILGREAEFRARVKEHFIQKLKGVVPF